MTRPLHRRTFLATTGAGLTVYTMSAHLRLQAAFELRRALTDYIANSSWAIVRATLAI